MSDTSFTVPVRDQVSDDEWQTRVDLAACYRLIAMQGWDDLVFTHISARVPGPDEHFLINAYGLLFEEMTASNLVKVDLHLSNRTNRVGYWVDVFWFGSIDPGMHPHCQTVETHLAHRACPRMAGGWLCGS
jgi:hypothetical protein